MQLCAEERKSGKILEITSWYQFLFSLYYSTIHFCKARTNRYKHMHTHIFNLYRAGNEPSCGACTEQPHGPSLSLSFFVCLFAFVFVIKREGVREK